MIVMDRDGRFLRPWGESVFRNQHGVDVWPDGTVWFTDDGDHMVRTCTPDGRVLMALGTPAAPVGFMSGRSFCRCCHTALSPFRRHLWGGWMRQCVHPPLRA